MGYTINKYTYVGNKAELIIYARTLEVAEQILGICNTDYPASWKWKPKKIGFCKAVMVETPPYELEQEQIEKSTKQLEKRSAMHKRFGISADDMPSFDVLAAYGKGEDKNK